MTAAYSRGRIEGKMFKKECSEKGERGGGSMFGVIYLWLLGSDVHNTGGRKSVFEYIQKSGEKKDHKTKPGSQSAGKFETDAGQIRGHDVKKAILGNRPREGKG